MNQFESFLGNKCVCVCVCILCNTFGLLRVNHLIKRKPSGYCPEKRMAGFCFFRSVNLSPFDIVTGNVEHYRFTYASITFSLHFSPAPQLKYFLRSRWFVQFFIACGPLFFNYTWISPRILAGGMTV